MIESVGTVAFVVSNATKSAAWYNERLGLEIRDQDGHWVTVAPRGATTILHLCKQKEMEPGNPGIAFHTKGIDATYVELVKNGVPFRHKLTHADLEHVRDVDRPGRERVRARAVGMTVRAGSDADWSK